jgi:hypothetical protein
MIKELKNNEKFQESIMQFKNDGYDVKTEDRGYCKVAIVSKIIPTASKDPFGNENGKAETLIEYQITGYDNGSIEVIKTS